MRTVAILAVVAGLARAACVAVPSGNILARDLSTAIPMFQALDPDTILGLAPFPGAVRLLSLRDMVLMGRRYGLAIPAGETVPSVCVERAVRHLSNEEVREALLSALAIVNVRLEVLEFSNQPFPSGRLEFQRAGLNKPPENNPETSVIWRGKLIYDAQRSLAVWARVRISVDREILLATETIPKGAVIRAEQIATTRIRQFPVLEPARSAPLVIAGKIARRTLAAGQPIGPEALDDPKDVVQGKTVHVEAIDGGASIRFDGIAQSSGLKGEMVMVHNPSSGRNFRALIEGREQVVVRGTL
jgi:flagella basal body P-ring formation protein FlgA